MILEFNRWLFILYLLSIRLVRILRIINSVRLNCYCSALWPTRGTWTAWFTLIRILLHSSVEFIQINWELLLLPHGNALVNWVSLIGNKDRCFPDLRLLIQFSLPLFLLLNLCKSSWFIKFDNTNKSDQSDESDNPGDPSSSWCLGNWCCSQLFDWVIYRIHNPSNIPNECDCTDEIKPEEEWEKVVFLAVWSNGNFNSKAYKR